MSDAKEGFGGLEKAAAAIGVVASAVGALSAAMFALAKHTAVWRPSDGWFQSATATQWQQGDFTWMMQMLNDEAACLTEAIDTAILSAEIVTDEPESGPPE